MVFGERRRRFWLLGFSSQRGRVCGDEVGFGGFVKGRDDWGFIGWELRGFVGWELKGFHREHPQQGFDI